MSYSAEAPPLGANEDLLRVEERALVLAANAGFVDAVAVRLRSYAEGGSVSPREVFVVGVAALHAAERNTSQQNTRHVDTIGTVLADSALAEPVNSTFDPVSDDHIAVLLESKLSETTKNPLISLLIGKGAISRGLKRELQIDIPDEAYDTFLAEISESSDGNSELADGGVGLLDPESTNDERVSALIHASTYDEMIDAYKNHPRAGTNEIDSLFNHLACAKILARDVSFDESVKFYDNLKRVESEDGGDEEAEAIARIHLALDIKFIHRAHKLADPQGDYSLLANLLKNYQLKTDTEHEDFEELRTRLDHYSGLAFSGQFARLQLSDIVGAEAPEDLRSAQQRIHDEAIELGDYSEVELDLSGLDSEDTPVELKDLYAEISISTDDSDKAKQIFIATVIDRLRKEKNSHTALSALAHLRELIDSADLKTEIAKIHDTRILRHAKKMLDDAKDKDGYARVYDFLVSTRFLLENEHPIVTQGRELFVDSFNKYNGRDDASTQA